MFYLLFLALFGSLFAINIPKPGTSSKYQARDVQDLGKDTSLADALKLVGGILYSVLF